MHILSLSARRQWPPARLALAAIVAVGLAGFTGPAAAQDRVGDAIDAAEATTRASARSQDRIDRLDAETRRALEAYRRAVWEAQQLEVYSEQLAELQQLQAAEKTDLEAALDDVPLKEDDLLPLMLRMVGTLDKLIQQDMPFLLEEREQRVASLKQLLGDPAASLTEQYRRVLEAYQIESDYGRGLDSERIEVEFEGITQVVDTLRVGRLALYFLSQDGQTAARWDKASNDWVPLAATDRPAVKQGIRIARETIAPELLTLPVPVAQSAGGS